MDRIRVIIGTGGRDRQCLELVLLAHRIARKFEEWTLDEAGN